VYRQCSLIEYQDVLLLVLPSMEIYKSGTYYSAFSVRQDECIFGCATTGDIILRSP
jgi:hypothetical protein